MPIHWIEITAIATTEDQHEHVEKDKEGEEDVPSTSGITRVGCLAANLLDSAEINEAAIRS